MVQNKAAGYLWITLGLFLLIFFGFRLILQLIAMFIGLSCVLKGLKILAMDRAVYNYSMHYFKNNFKK